MSLLSSLLLLRSDPRLLRVPPYLSLLCVLVGITWLFLLPLDDYSRKTYISENALLPGQVHTYFAGSDQNVFRSFKNEVEALAEKDNKEVNDHIECFFRAAGLKVARQEYRYKSSGVEHHGENIYAILHAPRGDATEAMVLIGPWTNMKGELNRSGVALVLTLARYFNRWSLWSKDIIFLITPDSRAGPQAWADAYHDAHSSKQAASLPLKSGALQGAVVIDYPFDHRFESLHMVYDGVNGQLPNLDLFNTVVAIASGQMGISVSLQQMWQHTDTYRDRLRTMLRGMLRQGLGHASGAHSSFIPYHVDAITLQPYGDGWQDEMAMGRVIESTFRSLNNLLEHLHQSFFFYLLMQANRFVSIGTYLPSAMLVAVNFTIMAIALWVESGRAHLMVAEAKSSDASMKTPRQLSSLKHEGAVGLTSTRSLLVEERHLSLPLAIVVTVQFLGVIPLYIFNHCPQAILPYAFALFAGINLAIPYVGSAIIIQYFAPTSQQYLLMKAFSLLFLGMFLSSLATLNFSLALMIGILAAPLTHAYPMPHRPVIAVVLGVCFNVLAPPVILFAGCWYWDIHIGYLLKEAAFGWNIWGMNTQVVVWCVWWPAWLLGAMLVLGKPKVQ